MTGFVKDDLMPRDTYGDWCVPPEDPRLIHSNDPARKTPGELIATAYFAHDLKLMARYARLAGKGEDAPAFLALAERLTAGLNKKYLNAETGVYANGAQTASVLPLAFDLVPAAARTRVFVDTLAAKFSGPECQAVDAQVRASVAARAERAAAATPAESA